MSNNNDQHGCAGPDCEWFVTGGGQVACMPGPPTCATARLVTAAPSDFHDQPLIDLTEQINTLLQAIPPDPTGRKLSFMYTRMGPLLGWVQHGLESVGTAGGVTAASDNETITQALGLLV